ncbi:hypothetical protein EVAR_46285_1 [Eumeta japonica]|uniref:Uncharacterized protein n=1 Tax=Eumeta variegata TaxID=151549 RepID=A0A4C1XZX3_EUMVA|nr:hypothetical protein EVAR_46285_1 [Eumeta japonica]
MPERFEEKTDFYKGKAINYLNAHATGRLSFSVLSVCGAGFHVHSHLAQSPEQTNGRPAAYNSPLQRRVNIPKRTIHRAGSRVCVRP